MCVCDVRDADGVRECGHRPGGRYRRGPVIWSTYRSSQNVLPLKFGTYIFPS